MQSLTECVFWTLNLDGVPNGLFYSVGPLIGTQLAKIIVVCFSTIRAARVTVKVEIDRRRGKKKKRKTKPKEDEKRQREKEETGYCVARRLSESDELVYTLVHSHLFFKFRFWRERQCVNFSLYGGKHD